MLQFRCFSITSSFIISHISSSPRSVTFSVPFSIYLCSQQFQFLLFHLPVCPFPLIFFTLFFSSSYTLHLLAPFLSVFFTLLSSSLHSFHLDLILSSFLKFLLPISIGLISPSSHSFHRALISLILSFPRSSSSCFLFSLV